MELSAAIITLVLNAAAAAQIPDRGLPDGISIGQAIEPARAALAEACGRTEEMKHTGAMAAPAKEIQVQIDCYGLEAFGRERKAEFMFNDGYLAFVWILVEKEELSGLENVLAPRHGPVVFDTGKDRVLRDGQVALRNDPPEVLYASPDMMRDLTGYMPQP